MEENKYIKIIEDLKLNDQQRWFLNTFYVKKYKIHFKSNYQIYLNNLNSYMEKELANKGSGAHYIPQQVNYLLDRIIDIEKPGMDDLANLLSKIEKAESKLNNILSDSLAKEDDIKLKQTDREKNINELNEKQEKNITTIEKKISDIQKTILKKTQTQAGSLSYMGQSTEYGNNKNFIGIIVCVASILTAWIFLDKLVTIEEEIIWYATRSSISGIFIWIMLVLINRIKVNDSLRHYYKMLATQVMTVSSSDDMFDDEVSKVVKQQVAMNMAKDPIFLFDIKNVEVNSSDSKLKSTIISAIKEINNPLVNNILKDQ